MKAGIAIDKWKLPIFTRHLKEAGYAYEEGPLMEGTLLLKVELATAGLAALHRVIAAAQVECDRKKK